MHDEANPFQSPQTISEPSTPISGVLHSRAPRYASGNTRATWSMAMLAMVLISEVISIGSDMLQLQLTERAMRGAAVGEAEIESNDSRQQLVGLLSAALHVGSAIAFLMWFHRTHRNLGSLRAPEIKYTPGWAVGSFFVPILNLFRPYQIMKEVWRGSDPQTAGDESTYARHAPVSALVGVWWTLWILGGILGQAAMRLALNVKDWNSLYVSTCTGIASAAVSVIGAVVTIALVRAVSQNQEMRHELVAAAEPKVIVDPFGPGFGEWPQR